MIPGTPVRWPGWQPASATSFRMPTGRRSRPGWPTPTCRRDRWTLQFGMAQVDDARGEYQLAADLAQAECASADRFRGAGQSLRRRRASGIRRSPARHVQPPSISREFSAFGLPTRRPVFVVGLPRSGTTLVEQILASHPRVFGAGELRLVKDILKQLPQAVGRMHSRWTASHSSMRPLSLRSPSAMNANCWPWAARRIGSWTRCPRTRSYLGWIATLFPQAILIYCRRDLRDVALSCWMTHLAHVRWACDPDHIAITHQRTPTPDPSLVPGLCRSRFSKSITSLWWPNRNGSPERLVAWCRLDWDPPA